jgi:hypothetical protein
MCERALEEIVVPNDSFSRKVIGLTLVFTNGAIVGIRVEP